MWKSTTPTKLQLCWTTTDAVSFLSADKQVIDISNSGSFLSPHSLSWGCKCVYPYGYIFIITHFYYHACYGHCFTMSMLSFLYTLALYGLMNSLFSQCYDLFKLTLPPDYFNTIRHHCPITRQWNIHVFIQESYTFVYHLLVQHCPYASRASYLSYRCILNTNLFCLSIFIMLWTICWPQFSSGRYYGKKDFLNEALEIKIKFVKIFSQCSKPLLRISIKD